MILLYLQVGLFQFLMKFALVKLWYTAFPGIPNIKMTVLRCHVY